MQSAEKTVIITLSPVVRWKWRDHDHDERGCAVALMSALQVWAASPTAFTWEAVDMFAAVHPRAHDRLRQTAAGGPGLWSAQVLRTPADTTNGVMAMSAMSATSTQATSALAKRKCRLPV